MGMLSEMMKLVFQTKQLNNLKFMRSESKRLIKKDGAALKVEHISLPNTILNSI